MPTQESLERWLNNEASPADMDLLNAWPDFKLYKKIDAHTKRIAIPVHDITSGMQELKERSQFVKNKAQETSKVITMSALLKIAAIFVLLAVSSVFVASISTNVETSLAQIEMVNLPDASKITLQKNTRVGYKKYSWPFNREVTLEGEAFFEVAKGETFTVTTSNGSVKVLGTSFNVNTKNDLLVVSCYEGLVTVNANGLNTLVSPGDSFTFGAQIVNNKVYTSKPNWIFNESSFVDVPLDIVLAEIENQYNVTITTKNIDVTLRYTGSFTHANITEALRTVTLPLSLSFSKDLKNDVQIYDPKKQ
ncbi:MAG: transmembrane sensor [Saprospiraceae bacterium]|jgi:transmembrane sensor